MATIEITGEKAQVQQGVSHTIRGADIDVVEESRPNEREDSYSQITRRFPPEVPTPAVPEWRAGRQEWFIIVVLSLISVMVALDATILVPVLPVSVSKPDC